MKTFDSTLAYYVNQLDNFDRTLHQPLYNVTWGRDISLRSNISMANESTSFTRSNIAYTGASSATGKPWVSSTSTAIPGVSIDGERVTTPLRLLAVEITYTSVELERSQLLGQPIDQQKLDAFNILYQMSIDEQVYIGDAGFASKGLLNNASVTAGSVVNGTSLSTLWVNKTPDEILKDVNSGLEAAWTASGYAACPDKLLLPPAQFAWITSQKVSNAGNKSILSFLRDESIALSENGRPLEINSVKWLKGIGAGGADRMAFYTNRVDNVRFPLVPVRRETPYYSGIRFSSPYIWAMGDTEIIRPETVLYRDGI